MAINLIDQHKNNEGILVGESEDFGEGYAEVAIYPGAPVGRGTNAGELDIPATAADAAGVALENMLPGADSLRAQHAIDAHIRYLREQGTRFMARIESGQDLAKLAFLKPGASGWVAGTDASDSCARLIQEGGTGGALGAAGYFLAKWGVEA